MTEFYDPRQRGPSISRPQNRQPEDWMPPGPIQDKNWPALGQEWIP